MKHYASVVSVIFAVFAAGLWWWSACVNVPLLKSAMGTLVSVLEDGEVIKGEAPFYKALATISRLNACAAACAGISALFQALSL
jgi:hypothetical protein